MFHKKKKQLKQLKIKVNNFTKHEVQIIWFNICDV